jgi:hypothetical protein
MKEFDGYSVLSSDDKYVRKIVPVMLKYNELLMVNWNVKLNFEIVDLNLKID